MSHTRVGAESSPRRLRLPVVLCAIACWAVGFAIPATAQGGAPPLPAPEHFVSDREGVLDPATRDRLAAICRNTRDRARVEIGVAIVRTTGGRDIFDYSLALARGWGVGAKDGDRAGLLLVVAIDDRKYFTQVSRHLEGDLPDGVVGSIQRERLVPALRRGEYGQGIIDTVGAYVDTLARERGFGAAGIDPGAALGPAPQFAPQGTSPGGPSGWTILLFLLGVIAAICLAVYISFRLDFDLLGYVTSTDESGGSTSDGGGDGGSSDGFGGGGDFGGGGAGGNW
jgi:uncharacterized protein